MLTRFLKYTAYQLLALGLLLIHMAIKTILPFPFDHINIIILIFLWITILNLPTFFYSSMLVCLFLLELFTSAPYGLNTAAVLLSYFLVYWFLHEVFTYYSWYIITITTIIGFVCYRIVWYVGANLFMLFSSNQFVISRELFTDWMYEVLSSILLMLFLYSIIAFFTPYFKPYYIKKRQRTLV